MATCVVCGRAFGDSDGGVGYCSYHQSVQANPNITTASSTGTANEAVFTWNGTAIVPGAQFYPDPSAYSLEPLSQAQMDEQYRMTERAVAELESMRRGIRASDNNEMILHKHGLRIVNGELVSVSA